MENVKIDKIRAMDGRVEIVSTVSGKTASETITRKEAIYRARALRELNELDKEDLLIELLKAANEARINETGQPYHSKALEMLLVGRKN